MDVELTRYQKVLISMMHDLIAKNYQHARLHDPTCWMILTYSTTQDISKYVELMEYQEILVYMMHDFIVKLSVG